MCTACGVYVWSLENKKNTHYISSTSKQLCTLRASAKRAVVGAESLGIDLVRTRFYIALRSTLPHFSPITGFNILISCE